jgi:ferritin-like metal-binding protein YciE
MAFEQDDKQPVNSALEELSNSDYEIKEGEPDITGWNVLCRSGVKIGEIGDLLFDVQAQKVRYLVVELQAGGDEEISDDDKRVLVPIGLAELHADEETLNVPVDSAEQLADLPAYHSNGVSPEDEVQIREFFGGSEAPYEHPQFYVHEHFDDDKFYNSPSLPNSSTIIPAEEMNDEGSAARAEKASQIVNRLDQADEEPKSTQFPEGRLAGEFQTPESLERENSQPVEETGNDSFVPEPESIEQEEAWQEEDTANAGSSRLMEFFVNELKDLLWAEKELAGTLPDMAEAATSAELKSAFEMHLTETETHVSRLKEVFGILGLEPESRHCDAMAGIIDEGDEIISATGEGTAQRDVGLIFAGQKAEHYEIASYGGMIALAKTLGYYDIAELFVLTLDEEKSADAKLTGIAERQANPDASQERTED